MSPTSTSRSTSASRSAATSWASAPTPPWPTARRPYWGVPDVDAALAALQARGATDHTPVTKVGEGIRVAAVREPGGSVLGIIENPHFAIADPPPEVGSGPGR